MPFSFFSTGNLPHLASAGVEGGKEGGKAWFFHRSAAYYYYLLILTTIYTLLHDKSNYFRWMVFLPVVSTYYLVVGTTSISISTFCFSMPTK